MDPRYGPDYRMYRRSREQVRRALYSLLDVGAMVVLAVMAVLAVAGGVYLGKEAIHWWLSVSGP